MPGSNSAAPRTQPSGRQLFRTEAVAAHTLGASDEAVLPVADLGVAGTLRQGAHLLRGAGEAIGAAVRRVTRRAGVRRMPVVLQTELGDCGAACLAMVLAYHGRHVPLARLRDLTGTDAHGVTARRILEAARLCGLRGHGVRAGVPGLAALAPGTILHWQFRHFVVLVRAQGNHVDIVDPAFGRRRVPLDVVRTSFTGVALALAPAAEVERPGRPVARPVRSWRALGSFVHSRSTWARLLALSIAVQLAGLAVPAFSKLLFDDILPHGDRQLLAVLSAAAGAMVLVSFLVNLARTTTLVRLQVGVDMSVTLRTLRHLVDLPYSFFQRRSTGDLLARIRSMSVIRDILTSVTLSAALDGPTVAIYLVVLAVADLPTALLVCGLCSLQLLSVLVSWRPLLALSAEGLERQATAQDSLVRLIAGIQTLKVGGAEPVAVQRWTGQYARELDTQARRSQVLAFNEAVFSSLRLLTPLILLAAGGYRVAAHSLTPGAMLAANALGMAVFTSAGVLADASCRLALLGAYLQRVLDIESQPREAEGRTTRSVPHLSGAVSTESVTYSYGPHRAPAVADVTVDVRPGQLLAIVGPSGSGKSTLAMLLAGLVEPDTGAVRYDGIDLRELEPRSLRSRIGVVTQHIALLPGTIRDNLCLGTTGVTVDEIEAAARLADIHDDILALPRGYDTLVTPDGGPLSGGGRQRLAIARAVLRSPAVLILDEATSGLDAALEARILRRLAGLGVTRIVVTHRESAITGADHVLVLTGGAVVARHGGGVPAYSHG